MKTKSLPRAAGVRLARNGQYIPTLNGKDISPTSFDEARALEIAQRAAAGEAAHTPTPWIIDDRDSASSVRIGSATDRQATGLVGRIYGNKAGDAHANAAFIVRACNSHPALVAALEVTTIQLERDHANVSRELDGCEDTLTRYGLAQTVKRLAAEIGQARAALTAAKRVQS